MANKYRKMENRPFIGELGRKNQIKAWKVYEFNGKRMNLHVLTLQLPLSLLANEKYIK